MQNRLFSELSNMFGKEVPLYDKSQLVNKVCNQTICALLSKINHVGFTYFSEHQLQAKPAGERRSRCPSALASHREYRWVAGYFFTAFRL